MAITILDSNPRGTFDKIDPSNHVQSRTQIQPIKNTHSFHGYSGAGALVIVTQRTRVLVIRSLLPGGAHDCYPVNVTQGVRVIITQGVNMIVTL